VRFFVQDYTQFVKRGGFIKHKYDHKQSFVTNVSQQTQNQLTLENIKLNAYFRKLWHMCIEFMQDKARFFKNSSDI